MSRPSPVPDGVAGELQRLVRRWHELPLDRALPHVPAVREVVERLAGEPVPDLGPAVLLDQLRVTAYDACRDGTLPPAEVEAVLAGLRHRLP